MMILYFRYLENIQNVFALIFKLYHRLSQPSWVWGEGGEEDLSVCLPLLAIKKKGVSFCLVDTMHFNREMHSNKKTCKASSYKTIID